MLLPPVTDGMRSAAIAAADAAGAVLRMYFRTNLAATAKHDESPVTAADRETEQVIRDSLSADFPDHGLFGEEDGLTRPYSPYRWVIDPIDGTRAFITGRPSFVTLISLLYEGIPLLGLMDQPVTGERWFGVHNERTKYRGNFTGKAGTRNCHDLKSAELSCTCPEMLGEHIPNWHKLKARCARNSWGGDGYAYGLLALGQIDLIAEASLKLWDWAALVPIIEGAGGAITDWQGKPLTPGSDGRVLAAGDPTLIPAAVAALA